MKIYENFLVNPIETSPRAKYIHGRVESPKHFDKRSFRLKTIPKGMKLTIGCPKGKWDPRMPKGKECKVGTRTQSVLVPKALGIAKAKAMVKELKRKSGLAVAHNPKRKEVKRSTSRRLSKTFKRATMHRPRLYEVSSGMWARSPYSGSKMRGVKLNPLGESLIIAGANPMAKKMRHNVWFGHHLGHAKAAKKGWRSRHNPPRGGVIQRTVGFDVLGNLPLVATGAVSAISTVAVPRFLGVTTPMYNYGTQAAVAIGGGMLTSAMLGRTHGLTWFIVGGAVILADALKSYVLQPMGFISDYSVQDYRVSDSDEEMVEAFPGSEVGAFPGSEVGIYPDVHPHGSPY